MAQLNKFTLRSSLVAPLSKQKCL